MASDAAAWQLALKLLAAADAASALLSDVRRSADGDVLGAAGTLLASL